MPSRELVKIKQDNGCESVLPMIKHRGRALGAVIKMQSGRAGATVEQIKPPAVLASRSEEPGNAEQLGAVGDPGPEGSRGLGRGHS